MKKALLIQQKEEQRKVKGCEELGEKIGDKYKKVESKLLVETTAAVSKKREKFDPAKDSHMEPMTMGGRLPTMG